MWVGWARIHWNILSDKSFLFLRSSITTDQGLCGPGPWLQFGLVGICLGVGRETMSILWQADSGSRWTAGLRAEACWRPAGWELSGVCNEDGHGMELGCHLLCQASQTEPPICSNLSNLCIPSCIYLISSSSLFCELVLFLKRPQVSRRQYPLASLFPGSSGCSSNICWNKAISGGQTSATGHGNICIQCLYSPTTNSPPACLLFLSVSPLKSPWKRLENTPRQLNQIASHFL